jgi:hypothetical protein
MVHCDEARSVLLGSGLVVKWSVMLIFLFSWVGRGDGQVPSSHSQGGSAALGGAASLMALGLLIHIACTSGEDETLPPQAAGRVLVGDGGSAMVVEAWDRRCGAVVVGLAAVVLLVMLRGMGSVRSLKYYVPGRVRSVLACWGARHAE